MAELLKDNPQLTSLLLRSTGLTDDNMEILAPSVARSKLQYLNLNCNQISASAVPHVVSIIESCPQLESIA